MKITKHLSNTDPSTYTVDPTIRHLTFFNGGWDQRDVWVNVEDVHIFDIPYTDAAEIEKLIQKVKKSDVSGPLEIIRNYSESVSMYGLYQERDKYGSPTGKHFMVLYAKPDDIFSAIIDIAIDSDRKKMEDAL